MSSMERALAGQRLECTLYIKFRKGELDFTLKELFNQAGLANMDSGNSVQLLKNVTLGELFTLTPALEDNPNLGDQYSLNMNPIFEDALIKKYTGVLKEILNTVPAETRKPEIKQALEHALVEKDNLKKIEQVFAILLEPNTRL